MFLHRFEQSRLRFRRRAVDLVGKNDVRKNWAFLKLKRTATRCGLRENLRSSDVGRHQIRRELDAVEGEIKDIRQSPDQKRFGQAGCTGKQAMSTAEQGNEKLINDLLLADDHLGQLRLDTASGLPDLLGRLLFEFVIHNPVSG